MLAAARQAVPFKTAVFPQALKLESFTINCKNKSHNGDPRYGLFALADRSAGYMKRVLDEDAINHLLDIL
jgi:hypothetical protein